MSKHKPQSIAVFGKSQTFKKAAESISRFLLPKIPAIISTMYI